MNDNRDALLSAIRDAWASVQKNRGLRAKLANSLTKRLEQVIKKKGGCANYYIIIIIIISVVRDWLTHITWGKGRFRQIYSS